MNALIGFVVGYLVLTGGYILVMHVKHVRDEGRPIPLFWKPPILVWGIVAILLDVAFNLVAGTLMFAELPPFGMVQVWRIRFPFFTEPMFTARVKRHWRGPDGWRKHVATWWRRQLNTFDEHIK